jgi:hypothetical protein
MGAFKHTRCLSPSRLPAAFATLAAIRRASSRVNSLARQLPATTQQPVAAVGSLNCKINAADSLTLISSYAGFMACGLLSFLQGVFSHGHDNDSSDYRDP